MARPSGRDDHVNITPDDPLGEELAPVEMVAAEPIDTHLPCIGCGYNLRGLRPGGRCPECGRGVTASLRAGGRELGGRLAGLSLPRQVWVLAVWPLAEQFLTFFVGFVDTALAGRLSVEATNALGVATYVVWLMRITQMAVGVGATAIIARAVGARHGRMANAALGQALLLGVVVGIGMGALIFALAPVIGQFTEMTGQSLRLCVLYLRVIAIALPVGGGLLIGAACLRGAGDTRSPFFIMLAVNVVNIVMSIAFVLMGFGVAGIAAGTVVAWGVGTLITIPVLIRGTDGMRLRWMRLRPRVEMASRIMRIGIPSLIEMLGFWAANFVIVKFVGMIHQHAEMGAHMVAIRLEAISYMPGFALGAAAGTLAGQYLGLGDPARAKRAVVYCWIFGAALMGFMGIWFFFTPEVLVRIVTDQAELLELAPPLLMICAPIQIFFGTAMVLSNALRGAGDTRTTMLLTFSSTYLVRVPAAYLLAVHLGWGVNGIWFALSGELVIRGCLYAWRFLQGGWTKVKV